MCHFYSACVVDLENALHLLPENGSLCTVCLSQIFAPTLIESFFDRYFWLKRGTRPWRDVRRLLCVAFPPVYVCACEWGEVLRRQMWRDASSNLEAFKEGRL